MVVLGSVLENIKLTPIPHPRYWFSVYLLSCFLGYMLGRMQDGFTCQRFIYFSRYPCSDQMSVYL